METWRWYTVIIDDSRINRKKERRERDEEWNEFVCPPEYDQGHPRRRGIPGSLAMIHRLLSSLEFLYWPWQVSEWSSGRSWSWIRKCNAYSPPFGSNRTGENKIKLIYSFNRLFWIRLYLFLMNSLGEPNISFSDLVKLLFSALRANSSQVQIRSATWNSL